MDPGPDGGPLRASPTEYHDFEYNPPFIMPRFRASPDSPPPVALPLQSFQSEAMRLEDSLRLAHAYAEAYRLRVLAEDTRANLDSSLLLDGLVADDLSLAGSLQDDLSDHQFVPASPLIYPPSVQEFEDDLSLYSMYSTPGSHQDDLPHSQPRPEPQDHTTTTGGHGAGGRAASSGGFSLFSLDPLPHGTIYGPESPQNLPLGTSITRPDSADLQSYGGLLLDDADDVDRLDVNAHGFAPVVRPGRTADTIPKPSQYRSIEQLHSENLERQAPRVESLPPAEPIAATAESDASAYRSPEPDVDQADPSPPVMHDPADMPGDMSSDQYNRHGPIDPDPGQISPKERMAAALREAGKDAGYASTVTTPLTASLASSRASSVGPEVQPILRASALGFSTQPSTASSTAESDREDETSPSPEAGDAVDLHREVTIKVELPRSASPPTVPLIEATFDQVDTPVEVSETAAESLDPSEPMLAPEPKAISVDSADSDLTDHVQIHASDVPAQTLPTLAAASPAVKRRADDDELQPPAARRRRLASAESARIFAAGVAAGAIGVVFGLMQLAPAQSQ